MLNTCKSEVIIVGPRDLGDNFSNGQITLHNITLASNNDVRNLGVTFDQASFFSLPHLESLKDIFSSLEKHCKKYIFNNNLSFKSAENIIHALVTLSPDYCNALLSG